MFVGATFTSCLEHDDSENESLALGYFTTDGNASQIILHQDGGGTVIPMMSSLKNPTEFLKNERYVLQFKYKEGGISADKMTVTDAEILAGEVIDVRNPLTAQEAAESKVSDPDSLFNINSISSAWAYRGYLTVLTRALYSVKDSKGVFPVINMTYDPLTDLDVDRIKLTLCYNRRTAKDAQTASTPYEFATSFRLSQLQSIVPGTDTIQVAISAMGVDKPYQVKVARKDLVKGNY